MNTKKQFDFWYAMNNTELISAPSSRLETFDDTVVNYYLITELMDDVNQVRIREGQLKALQPEIIKPEGMGQVDLEDFGEDAREYAEWLAEHNDDLKIIKYGFRIHKQETEEYVVDDHIDHVIELIADNVAHLDDPLSAVLVGVDAPWEVCLLKLMVELVQTSARGNMNDFQQQVRSMEQHMLNRVDRMFREAVHNPELIGPLSETIERHGLWDQYQDRFFALVKMAHTH